MSNSGYMETCVKKKESSYLMFIFDPQCHTLVTFLNLPCSSKDWPVAFDQWDLGISCRIHWLSSFAIFSSPEPKAQRWAFSIPMVRRPSVVRRRRPQFQTWISLHPVGWSQWNFIRSIIGMGERLQEVLDQIGSKLWFPWQQIAPIGL